MKSLLTVLMLSCLVVFSQASLSGDFEIEETNTYPSEKFPETTLYRIVGVESWDVLYIRPEPHTKNKPIGSIPYNGTNVQILKRKKDSLWVYVRYREFEGWAHSRMLKPQN
jgi:hypothetical protein